MSTTNGGNGRWRRQEQAVAEALGAERIPNRGARRSDIESGPFGVEVKTVKAIPARLMSALDQSVGACVATGKVPVVVLNQPRVGRKPLRLVVMRFEDWQQHNGPAAPDEGSSPEPGG